MHCFYLLSVFFEEVKQGVRRCDVRIKDRSYKVGDRILFKELQPGNNAYTGDMCWVYITHIMEEEVSGIDNEYCVLSFKREAV